MTAQAQRPRPTGRRSRPAQPPRLDAGKIRYHLVQLAYALADDAPGPWNIATPMRWLFDLTAGLEIECSACQSGVGRWCRTSGGHATSAHAARRRDSRPVNYPSQSHRNGKAPKA